MLPPAVQRLVALVRRKFHLAQAEAERKLEQLLELLGWATNRVAISAAVVAALVLLLSVILGSSAALYTFFYNWLLPDATHRFDLVLDLSNRSHCVASTAYLDHDRTIEWTPTARAAPQYGTGSQQPVLAPGIQYDIQLEVDLAIDSHADDRSILFRTGSLETYVQLGTGAAVPRAHCGMVDEYRLCTGKDLAVIPVLEEDAGDDAASVDTLGGADSGSGEPSGSGDLGHATTAVVKAPAWALAYNYVSVMATIETMPWMSFVHELMFVLPNIVGWFIGQPNLLARLRGANGRSSGLSVTYSVALAEGYIESAEAPLSTVRLALSPHGVVVNRAILTATAQFRGIRYWMYHWFWFTAAVGIAAIAAVQTTCLAIAAFALAREWYKYWETANTADGARASAPSPTPRVAEGSARSRASDQQLQPVGAGVAVSSALPAETSLSAAGDCSESKASDSAVQTEQSTAEIGTSTEEGGGDPAPVGAGHQPDNKQVELEQNPHEAHAGRPASESDPASPATPAVKTGDQDGTRQDEESSPGSTDDDYSFVNMDASGRTVSPTLRRRPAAR